MATGEIMQRYNVQQAEEVLEGAKDSGWSLEKTGAWKRTLYLSKAVEPEARAVIVVAFTQYDAPAGVTGRVSDDLSGDRRTLTLWIRPLKPGARKFIAAETLGVISHTPAALFGVRHSQGEAS